MKDYIQYLLSLEPKGIKLGLERTEALLNTCNNPQKNFYSIQVIGTNGKGSTSAMIANILKVSGYKVGLYTSPHLCKINERIRINGQSISNASIIDFIDRYKQNIEQLNSSFFETITALAVWYFNQQNIDIAILETGLGGRLDSVTACDANLLVCTSISKDHQHILGNSINQIAYEKIYALKKNMLCISIKHNQSIITTFNNHARSIHGKINYVDSKKPNKHITLNGHHQLDNQALAIQAIKSLTKFNISSTNIKLGLSSTKWPGRIQKIYDKPTVYFDVAHNDESFISLCNFIKTIQGLKVLILALQKNKKLNKSISTIESNFDKIIITQTNVRNYKPANKLARIFNNKKVEIITDSKKAIQFYKQLSKFNTIIIAGSHYLGPIISKEFKISFENI